MKKALLLFLLFLIASPATAREPRKKSSFHRGTIILSIHQPNGQLAVEGYGLAIFPEGKKKPIKLDANRDVYEFTLPSGPYSIAVYAGGDEKSREPVTIYNKVNVLPETVLHKKLFTNHLASPTKDYAQGEYEQLK